MKFQEIRAKAQEMSIDAGKMKKRDLIRVIQRNEGNTECFDTGSSSRCGQDNCLWMADCT